jgi:hypothetical protein
MSGLDPPDTVLTNPPYDGIDHTPFEKQATRIMLKFSQVYDFVRVMNAILSEITLSKGVVTPF